MSGGAVNGSQEGAIGAGFASRRRAGAAIVEIDKLCTLSELGLADLMYLRDALTTMIQVSGALLSADRFFVSEMNRTRAGHLLCAFDNILDDYRSVVVEEARGRLAKDVPEAECQAEILLLAEIENGTATEEIAHQASCSANIIRSLRRESAQ